MRSILVGRLTRRPASSVTSRVGESEVCLVSLREHANGNASRSAQIRTWSAVASAARHRFGSCAGDEESKAPPKPAHSKLGLKLKIPSPSLPRERRQVATGSFARRFPVRPEHLARAFKCCDNVQAGLLASRRFRLATLHSGATARDSHPLPYSPRFYAGHRNVLSKIIANAADNNTCFRRVSMKPRNPKV